MNVAELKHLKGCTEEEVCAKLKQFNEKNSQVFSFADYNPTVKKEAVEAILSWLQSPKISSNTSIACLQAFRIISRERTNVESLTSDTALGTLISMSGIGYYAKQNHAASAVTIIEGDQSVMVEALKCLSNIIFNSIEAQKYCVKSGCVVGIVQRLKTYGDPGVQFNVKFFDMRILFLLSALPHCIELRAKITDELHGIIYLMEVLDMTVKEAGSGGLNDQQVDLCSEILKVLFNLLLPMAQKSLAEEKESFCMRLVCIIHDLLTSKISSKDKQEVFHSNIINLLMVIPAVFYEELLTPALGDDAVTAKQTEFDGKNVEAIIVILAFLEQKLSNQSNRDLHERLTPVLICLAEGCKNNRVIRKFCRQKVLPPLKDEVKRLPQEGDSLRNKLCKYLTCPVTTVKDCTARLIFILCKENVKRMVKYTGYGNSAGLLAELGLLKPSGNMQKTTSYSSDSGDSDTEEYLDLIDKINPITGRWEPTKSDPMAGMSEEQKEYEAQKLLNHIDRLQREGVFQPCTIGDDGKPKPVEHVSQLLTGAEGGLEASDSE